jgi:hypothetical protein
VGLTYLVHVAAETRCWLQGPVMEDKSSHSRGVVGTKRQVAAKACPPPSVEMVAHSIPRVGWYRRTVSEGSKGPITYECTTRRVTLCRDGRPDRVVWLVLKRSICEQPRYWYYISNAPLSTRLPVFVWLSGMRWAVEQCFEEAKTTVGMDHYEVRKYPGWHHHMLTGMLAHFFLWYLKLRWGKKSACAYSVPIAHAPRSGRPPTGGHTWSGSGISGLGAEAQSWRISGPSKATRNRNLNKVSL